MRRLIDGIRGAGLGLFVWLAVAAALAVPLASCAGDTNKICFVFTIIVRVDDCGHALGCDHVDHSVQPRQFTNHTASALSDENLGGLTDVIDANLGHRPVYVLRLDDREVSMLADLYELDYIDGIDASSLTRVIRRKATVS